MTTRQRIEAVARERFGFAALRPGQAEAVASVLDGRDTLAVMPTGAGKSAIYQIAALLTDGPTIVVSPLIALQRDQVQALEERGIADAAHANRPHPRRTERRPSRTFIPATWSSSSWLPSSSTTKRRG